MIFYNINIIKYYNDVEMIYIYLNIVNITKFNHGSV